MSDELLTTAEAAARLKVSKYTVCRYIKRGVLPAAKPLPGSPYRIPAAAVERLVAVEVAGPVELELDEAPLQFAPRSARSRAQQGRRRAAAA